MKKAVMTHEKCDHSPFCAAKRVCPVKAITQKASMFSAEVPVINADTCIGCGKCVQVCPHGAIRMK